MRRLISMLTAVIMLISCINFVYAADADLSPEGFAVVANGDVSLHNTMRINGDVFANGSVVVDNAGNNIIDGNIINTGEFVLPTYSPDNPTGTVTNNAESRDINYDIIADKCEAAAGDVTIFDNVAYANEYDWLTVASWVDDYRDGITVSENTYFKGLILQQPLTIDTTNGDVYVKIDSLTLSNTAAAENSGCINIVGDNKAYIYIGASFGGIEAVVNCDIEYTQDSDRSIMFGDSSKVELYVDGKGENVAFHPNTVISGKIYITNAKNVEVGGVIQGDVVTDTADLFTVGSSGTTTVTGNLYAENASEVIIFNDVYGNLVSSAKKLTVTGGASDITGIAYVPYAEAVINATDFTGIHGQLVTKTLDLYGTGVIIYDEAVADKFYEGTDGVFVAEEVIPSEEPTEEPVVTAEPTEEPISGFNIEVLIPNDTEVRAGGPIRLTSDYAYLYGYSDTVSGADQPITREEVSALVNRVLLQNYARDGFRKPNYESFDDLYCDWWSHSAVEYMTKIGVYSTASDSVMPWQPASRWEVAKLVAVSLGLEPSDDNSNFNFLDKDNYFCKKYYRYIKAMVDYGYYTGHNDGTIRAEDSMTRAEFVTMFNRIIGRTEENGYTLENLCEVVPEPNMYTDDLYESHWAYLDILNASYSFTDGKVDLSKKLDRTALDYELFD